MERQKRQIFLKNILIININQGYQKSSSRNFENEKYGNLDTGTGTGTAKPAFTPFLNGIEYFKKRLRCPSREKQRCLSEK